MDKLKMHSPDLSQGNLEKIRSLFPHCVTETKDDSGKLKLAIDFDQLKQELSGTIVEGSKERYQLSWPGKREALLTANAPIAKTLRACREESVNFDNTENLFIEGDNLDALKLLQETYLDKVKVIYIDPPYNTGKDFIYDDDFAIDSESYMQASAQEDDEGNQLVANLESNGRFHSDWLSMIYSRLKVARNLLAKDGVLFISIDDNEASNLQKVCDEIFGNDNLMFVYTIKVRYEGKTLVEDMLYQKVVENVFVYAKDRSSLKLVRETEDYNYDKFIFEVEELDTPEVIELGGREVKVFQKDQYKIVKKTPSKDGLKEVWASGSILDGNSSGRFFRDYLTGRYEVDGYGVLYKVENIGDDNRDYRYFTGPQKVGATKGKYYQGVPNKVLNSPEDAKKRKPIVTYHDLAGDFGNCRHEGNTDFRSGKKPQELYKKLFKIIPWNENDVVLDFFAGSSSTAQAVMEANIEDNLKRKFLMVQLNEECDKKSDAYKSGFRTIADLSKERIRRTGTSIDKDIDIDIGFRVLKIDSSNMKEVFYRSEQINQADMFAQVENIKEDRTDEDLLFQVLLDWGVGLTLPISNQKVASKDVFFVNADEDGEGADLIACFGKNISNDLIKELAEKQPLRVVFRDDGFANDSVKINVEQIFKQISPMTDVKSI